MTKKHTIGQGVKDLRICLFAVCLHETHFGPYYKIRLAEHNVLMIFGTSFEVKSILGKLVDLIKTVHLEQSYFISELQYGLH